jgi:hypothetical protein
MLNWRYCTEAMNDGGREFCALHHFGRAGRFGGMRLGISENMVKLGLKQADGPLPFWGMKGQFPA